MAIEAIRFADREGRTVILPSAATNQLMDLFQADLSAAPQFPLLETDFSMMANMGMNVVRLAFNWSSLEPQPGIHSEAMLSRIKQAVGGGGRGGG